MLHKEYDLLASVGSLESTMYESYKFPLAQVDYSLWYILCEMYEGYIFVVRRHALIGKHGVIKSPSLFEWLLREFNLSLFILVKVRGVEI